MLSDGQRTYTWEHGRQLQSVTVGNTAWYNLYDENGIRAERTRGTVSYKYSYEGGKLKYMSVGSNKLYFTYDFNGAPLSINYNGTEYYYVTNLQGDVVAILNAAGTAVVTYTYDAWGNPLTQTGSMSSTLGTHNPLRYRGYVYDTDTGLYYLLGRYYDPEIGRFINADETAYLGADGTLTGYNLFIYCRNNPVLYYDPVGNMGIIATSALIVLAGGIVGGLLGAFTAAATGGNVLESTIKGALNGMISSLCGILPIPPLAAIGLSGLLGAGVDLGAQAVSQYCNTGNISWSKIDGGSIAKTASQNALGTAIPQFGAGANNAADAFATALIWGEGATYIAVADVIVTNATSKNRKNTSQSTKNQYTAVFENGRKIIA